MVACRPTRKSTPWIFAGSTQWTTLVDRRDTVSSAELVQHSAAKATAPPTVITRQNAIPVAGDQRMQLQRTVRSTSAAASLDSAARLMSSAAARLSQNPIVPATALPGESSDTTRAGVQRSRVGVSSSSRKDERECSWFLALIERCSAMSPNQIPLGVYTHLNFAFVSVDPTTFRIEDMDSFTGTLYRQISSLKLKDPNLEVWVSVGGWSFNDPGPTATVFSTLARDTNAQQAFFASLITFMVNNGFDGVDLDWYASIWRFYVLRNCADQILHREYPVAPERGGSPDDFENFPKFLRNLRTAMNQSGYKFGLSITLVSANQNHQGALLDL